MNDPSGYRVRLRVRLAKSLNSTDVSRVVNLAGREVAITSETKDQPLSDTSWMELRALTELAGVCSRLGIDVGQDKPTRWLNEEFARSMGLLQPHERLRPNIHGLAILPDDDFTRVPGGQAAGKVLVDLNQFARALTELAAGPRVRLSAAAEGLRLFNLALLNPQPLAQVVLAISAVEALGQDQKWTEAQAGLLTQLAAQVEAEASGHDDERMEIAEALRELHRISLRQGVMRVLSGLGLQQLRKEWDRVYGIRSGLFHGTAQVAEHEVNELAASAITLCGRIILTLAERDGVTLPSIADVHFPRAQG
jgi:hypothetical protein